MFKFFLCFVLLNVPGFAKNCSEPNRCPKSGCPVTSKQSILEKDSAEDSEDEIENGVLEQVGSLLKNWWEKTKQQSSQTLESALDSAYDWGEKGLGRFQEYVIPVFSGGFSALQQTAQDLFQRTQEDFTQKPKKQKSQSIRTIHKWSEGNNHNVSIHQEERSSDGGLKIIDVTKNFKEPEITIKELDNEEKDVPEATSELEDS
ncbi:MAG: hypothetical protein BGO07_03785 [Alphaproteobacteria bacterium 40-19]|nr:MAG: hypothetical protein BGO07_03785 [Alphaproteobacteria bacterium 40-19]